jgi:hypothetical protein
MPLLILKFILKSFLYQNDFIVVHLLLCASNNSFRSDAVWVFFPRVVDAAGMLPCIIMLELLSILNFMLTSFLYQNSFLVIPLLLRVSYNSFRSDAVCFLAQMLFMLDIMLRCIIMLELLSIVNFILTSFLYQNAFIVIPLLLRARDNSFRSATVWLFAPKLCVLTLCRLS